MFTLLRAELLEAEGDVTGASKTLLDLYAIERALGMAAARIWPGPSCVRLALAAGNPTAASEIADDLASIATYAATSASRGAAACARGLVDSDAEVVLEAVAHYEQASVDGPRLDLLTALEIAGSVCVAQGRRDEALSCLRRALGVADQLGAGYDARRLSATLRDLGVRSGARGPRQRDDTGWGSLTEAEREVAKLVDAGLRNAEIGEQLFVSRRTVESHMSRLYSKLGAANRVALAKIIRERGVSGAE
jgi:DNA-binding CsgD family transcriptional regulator